MSQTADFDIPGDGSVKFEYLGGLAQVVISGIGGGDLTLEVSIDGGSTWLSVKEDAAQPDPTTLSFGADGSYTTFLPTGFIETTANSGATTPLLRATLAGSTASAGSPCRVLILPQRQ